MAISFCCPPPACSFLGATINMGTLDNSHGFTVPGVRSTKGDGRSSRSSRHRNTVKCSTYHCEHSCEDEPRSNMTTLRSNNGKGLTKCFSCLYCNIFSSCPDAFAHYPSPCQGSNLRSSMPPKYRDSAYFSLVSFIPHTRSRRGAQVGATRRFLRIPMVTIRLFSSVPGFYYRSKRGRRKVCQSAHSTKRGRRCGGFY